MPTKRKPKSRIASGKSKGPAPNESASTVTPAERLARLLKSAGNRGIGPMTEAELTRLVEECRAAWPNPKEIDDFIGWLHQARREGRYD